MARLLSSSSSDVVPRTTTTTRCLLAAVVALGLAVGQASAQDDDDPNHGVVFLYPATKDLIFNLMDTINVTYTSPFPTPNLYAFCDGGSRQGMCNILLSFLPVYRFVEINHEFNPIPSPVALEST
jgi:hypothetical protein